MCGRKKANPLNLMNRDWKSERGREEREREIEEGESGELILSFENQSAEGKNRDKQRWREC